MAAGRLNPMRHAIAILTAPLLAPPAALHAKQNMPGVPRLGILRADSFQSLENLGAMASNPDCGERQFRTSISDSRVAVLGAESDPGGDVELPRREQPIQLTDTTPIISTKHRPHPVLSVLPWLLMAASSHVLNYSHITAKASKTR